MDSALIPEGAKRCSPTAFFFWTLPWLALLAYGGISVLLCLGLGLNQTNMSNIFAFALWIVFDLVIIALGAGAFFTGFLTYIIGKEELKAIINAAVIIGVICYSGALAVLGIGMSAKEMRRNSDFLKELDKKLLLEENINFYHIASRTDQLIRPYTSALLGNKEDRQYILNGIGHASLLYSKKVNNKIASWLS